MIDFSLPRILRPKSKTQAVTPDPQLLIVGNVVSISFAVNILASSLSDLRHPVVSSTKSVKGRFLLPVICPERTPFLGSATSPLNLAAPRASKIYQSVDFLER
jgi:hypothetical protein